jgi:hypothetical protein
MQVSCEEEKVKSPLGIEIKIGQRWKELDPRFDPLRVVTVLGFFPATERVIIQGPTGAITKAKASRFHGKRNGYAPE